MRPRMPIPIELGNVLAKTFRITWSDGHRSEYAWRTLRLNCPCAICRGEWRERRHVDPATIPADIRALRVERVGAYALRFIWTDGHSSGIYPFNLLRHDLCECAEHVAGRVLD